jgi:hypothetical protein
MRPQTTRLDETLMRAHWRAIRDEEAPTTARQAIRSAARAGIAITLRDGGGLVLAADSDLPAAIIRALARHKDEIVTLLGQAGWPHFCPAEC